MAERALPALLLIALAAVLGLVLRLVHLGADPPLELSRSNAEVMDAGWYLAPAVERARGRPSSVPPQYDKPLVRWTAAPFFAGGVSLERAHAWAASWGLLLVIFGAGAAWTAFGRRAAVFAAVLLANSFLLVGYGRTPVVYGPLCACLAGVAWLHAAALGRWAAPGAWSCAGARVASLATAALAWVALGAVALALKEAAVVAAPGLALGWIAAVRRRGFAAGLLAAGTILAATVLWLAEPQLLWLTWHKAVLYFGDAQPLAVLKRLLAAPFQSGVAGKAPVVCALAWLGVLGALRPQAQAQTAGEGGPGPMRALPSRAFAAALAGWLGSWLIVFGMFSYHEPGYQQATPPPTRYFVPLLVPAALLGAGWLGRLSAGGAPLAPPRLAFALPWAALGAYWALGAVLTESWPLLAGTDGAGAPGWLVRAVRFPVLAAVGLLAGGALAVAVVRRARRQLRAGAHAPGRPRLAVLLLLAAVCASGARLGAVLGTPSWSLREANRFVAAALAEGARVIGTWAHALSWQAPHLERRLPPVRMDDLVHREGRAMTHLLIDEGWMGQLGPRFAQAGVRLVPLARLAIRGHPVVLFRFPWAEALGYRPSPLERAVERGQPQATRPPPEPRTR